MTILSILCHRYLHDSAFNVVNDWTLTIRNSAKKEAGQGSTRKKCFYALYLHFFKL